MKKTKYIAKPFPENIKMAVYEAQNGVCAVEGCLGYIHSFHHCKPNTKTNNKLYPLFTQSIFNCRGVCSEHHTNYAQWNITDALCRAYEEWLEQFMVSMPFSGVTYEKIGRG